MQRTVFGVALLAAFVCCPSVGAAPPDAASHPLSVSAGGHLLLTFQDVCRKSSPDTVECSSGTGWTGLHVAPRWRVTRPLSLGLLAGVAWRPSSEGTVSTLGGTTEYRRRMLRLSAEARIRPFDLAPLEPWVGLEVGVVSVRDGIKDTGSLKQEAGVNQTGPIGSCAVGADVFFVPSFAVGLELRGVLIPLGDNPPDLPGQEATNYGTMLGVSLGLNLTLRP